MNFVNSLKNPARQAEVLGALRMVAESGNFSNGICVFRLEQFFGKLQNNYAVAFNSTGSALYSLYRYYHSTGHKHVAVANNSFIGCGAMALEAGYDLYLIDSSPEHPSMSVDSLVRTLELNRQITMVVLSHLGGWKASDYLQIANVCMDRELVLIEDCSHVLGMHTGVLPPGKLGEASVWGFQSQGAVPVGEGGMVCTMNVELRDYAKRFRSYGRQKCGGGTTTYTEGMSLGMSEWAAAVAHVQLKHLDEILEARRSDAQALQSIAPCLLGGETNYTKYPVHPDHANKRHTAPSIYALCDQLAGALTRSKHVHIPTNLLHSSRWAQNHRCLPVGEGLYSGMEDTQIAELLRVA